MVLLENPKFAGIGMKMNARYKSTEFLIDDQPIGGNQKIVIQSMITASLKDTEKCVKQIENLIDKGCEMVRLSVVSKSEIEHFLLLKKTLSDRGISCPLIADIHYNQELAFQLVPYADKIRINPGNFLGNPKKDWDDHSYDEELEKNREAFIRLIRKCNEYNTAIRIGVNHGSLSDRVLWKYGDTPLGMAISAMEFAECCKEQQFNKALISLKSSDPEVMIESNRLMAEKMREHDLQLPLHLGVTEAGNGVAARVKSTYGISTLLSESIGDTIRVSLTEDPVAEIGIAKSIIKHNELYHNSPSMKRADGEPLIVCNRFPKNIHPNNAIYTFENAGTGPMLKNTKNSTELPIYEYESSAVYDGPACLWVKGKLGEEKFTHLSKDIIWILEEEHLLNNLKVIVNFFANAKIILRIATNDENRDDIIVRSTNLAVPLLKNNAIQGMWITSNKMDPNICDELALEIMSVSGKLSLTADYVACPGCSRTLFELQEITSEIQEKTRHLAGVKIGIMGCVINGLGEMRNADYGYVGSGVGKVNLYRKKKLIKKSVPEKEAVHELLTLINSDRKIALDEK